MLQRLGVAAGGLACLATPALAKLEIDPMKDDFGETDAKKIDGILNQNREFGVSAFWYFSNTRADKDFKDVFNEAAKKTKNMIVMKAVDCDKPANKKHCEGLKYESTPYIEIVPPMPMPKFAFKGDLSKPDKLLSALYKQIPSHKVNVIETKDAYSSLIKKNPTKPKVLLFSEKNKVPVILKGLSTEVVFARSTEFGFVSKEKGEEVLKESGAAKKKLPAVLMVNKGKKEWFKLDKGQEMNFQTLYTWINLYSESGMGDTVKAGAGGGASAGAEAEMEMEEMEEELPVREIKDKTQKELCFGQKSVCGILLTEGKPDGGLMDTVKGFEDKFVSKNERAVKYNWMWMDVSVESEFKKAIEDMEPKLAEKEGRDAETIKYPTMIFVKPPKKKREEKLLSYVKLENGAAVDEDKVSDMVDRIAGGASYARADLPKFVNRKALKKAADKAAKAEL